MNEDDFPTLPERSRSKYIEVYMKFVKWKEQNNIQLTTEFVLLKYFDELGLNKAPSTLWSNYSMMKNVMKIKENIDIGTYSTLTELLSKKNIGFQPKKTVPLTAQQVRRFLDQAPDRDYLGMKVKKISTSNLYLLNFDFQILENIVH